MLEGRLTLPVRIWNFTIVLPFAEQEGLASGLRGLLVDVAQVIALHDQHQIGVLENLRRQLTGTMRCGLLAVLRECREGVLLDRLVDQCSQTGGTDHDVAVLNSLSQQVLCSGAAANIADANDEHLIEHAESRHGGGDRRLAKLSRAGG